MDIVQLQPYLEVSKNMVYNPLNSMIIIHFSSISLLIVQKIIMHMSPASARRIKSLFVQKYLVVKIFLQTTFHSIDVSDKNDDVTVKIKIFQSIWVKIRFNEGKNRLKRTATDANICFIIGFMKEQLPKVIPNERDGPIHLMDSRNHNYLFWNFKIQGWKNLQPYISNSKEHDRVFTKIAVEDTLVEENLNSADVVIIDTNTAPCSISQTSILSNSNSTMNGSNRACFV